MLSGKSFMYMKSNRGRNREPLGIPESTFSRMRIEHLGQLVVSCYEDNFLTI